MVTASEPEVDACEVQDAAHEVEFVEDQVRVEVLSSKTDVGSADRLTLGNGTVGVDGVELPPPPPPPPQEANIKEQTTTKNFCMRYKMHHQSYI